MLARVALIALGALLLVFTGYLVVQVNAGPRADVAATAPAALHAGRAAAPEPSAPEDERAAADEPADRQAARAANIPPPVDPLTPISPSSFGTGATGTAASNVTAAASAVTAAANLQFDEANKLYDRRDYEEARALALSLLKEHPTSVRMRRIVVASSCIMGDQDVAQQHYLLLPEKDRGDMRVRCVPYGSAFHE